VGSAILVEIDAPFPQVLDQRHFSIVKPALAVWLFQRMMELWRTVTQIWLSMIF
jgi:hypothetical protein